MKRTTELSIDRREDTDTTSQRPQEGKIEPGDVHAIVREKYAEVLRSERPKKAGRCCCHVIPSADAFASTLGYDKNELAQILPEGANLGLSCGNPGAIAALRPGEVVLDLGSGAGFDAFLCGPKVGPTGRVIGVDMTPAMVRRARANATGYRVRTGLDNVEFREGQIEQLPVEDSSVDVVISNCVINLSPDKPRVWSEVARVLRPGGRVAVSDTVLLRPLPAEIRASVDSLVGCLAGASELGDLRAMLSDAGLTDARLVSNDGYIDALVDGGDPLYLKLASSLPAGHVAHDFVTSMDITAFKPSVGRVLDE
ncbi:Methyltransferase domain [Carpediemonas membranifera]|uniref:Arsenite methyltransferase n=1 Tax=Carpediemonas membranifera TaxID=201153 RepID=A0A8J6BZ21_9EUKA|nr:Methyltransferase domain [Carpediemonas membranifera]|eukprot:KAG9395106.1 Methyltransferase domain [Carpediemonas membranifera]